MEKPDLKDNAEEIELNKETVLDDIIEGKELIVEEEEDIDYRAKYEELAKETTSLKEEIKAREESLKSKSEYASQLESLESEVRKLEDTYQNKDIYMKEDLAGVIALNEKKKELESLKTQTIHQDREKDLKASLGDDYRTLIDEAVKVMNEMGLTKEEIEIFSKNPTEYDSRLTKPFFLLAKTRVTPKDSTMDRIENAANRVKVVGSESIPAPNKIPENPTLDEVMALGPEVWRKLK